MATSYPSDGIEFAIRLFDGKPGSLVHPAATTERTTEGWQVLRFD